jgi:hypothetical protein
LSTLSVSPLRHRSVQHKLLAEVEMTEPGGDVERCCVHRLVAGTRVGAMIEQNVNALLVAVDTRKVQWRYPQ